MDVIALSHGEDLDGIAAATIVRIKYEVPHDRVMYIDYSAGQLKRARDWVKSLSSAGTMLFITDLSVNDSKLDLYREMIMSVKSKGGAVVYLDHHPWGAEAKKCIPTLCDHAVFGEQKECASEIAARYLKVTGANTRRLLRMCHFSDNNIKAESEDERAMIKAYSMAITYYNTLPEKERRDRLVWLSDMIARGDTDNPILKYDADEFERASKERTREMIEDLSFVGNAIAVGFAGSVQPTYAASLIFRKAERPISVYINTDACKGSIRSTGCDISGLAKSLGGGGHPCAAGFEFSIDRYDVKTIHGRTLLLKRIESVARELGLLA